MLQVHEPDSISGFDQTTQELDVGENSAGYVGFQLSGTFSLTLTWEGSIDGTVWNTVVALNKTNNSIGGTGNAIGIFQIDCAGLRFVRGRCTSYTSGTCVVNKLVQAK